MKVYIPFNEDYFAFTNSTELQLIEGNYHFRIQSREYGDGYSGYESMANCVWLPTIDNHKFMFPAGLVVKIPPVGKADNFRLKDSIPKNYRYSRARDYIDISIPKQKLNGVLWNSGQFKVNRELFAEVEFNLVGKP